MVNLARHRMMLDHLCSICFQKLEFTIHVLWRCSSLKYICNICSKGVFNKVRDSESFFDFVLVCKDKVDTQCFEFLCIVWWRIWFRWNQEVHTKVLLPVDRVLE